MVAEETEAVLTLIGNRVETHVVMHTPRGVSGAGGLAGSIGATVHMGGCWPARVEIGTPLEYGISVEYGREPGGKMPPRAPIELWARRKLGLGADEAEAASWAIARHIAIHGTEGARMFQKAWEELDDWVTDELHGIPGRVVKRLAEGGACH